MNMLVGLHLENSVQSQVVDFALHLVSVLGGNEIPSLVILLEELRKYGPLTLPQGVKEIKEKLGEYASYDEIRFVFEAYKKHIPA